MIRRFDEVLAEKASKTAIQEIYEHFHLFVKDSIFMDYKAVNNEKFSKIDEET